MSAITVMVTFVGATIILATFVHIRNISAVTEPILIKLEQIPTIKLTFVQTTFVLVKFVHNRNILAVTDPILIKL